MPGDFEWDRWCFKVTYSQKLIKTCQSVLILNGLLVMKFNSETLLNPMWISGKAFNEKLLISKKKKKKKA